MALDIELLERAYFGIDEPVPYKLMDGNTVLISPVSIRKSEVFLPCIDVLMVDKNSLPEVKYIQMSYLQFLCSVLLQEDINAHKLVMLLSLCLRLNYPRLMTNETGQFYLHDDEANLNIDAKSFDEIKQIILYQNIIGFDDSYVNPDLKKSMAEQDRLKNQNFDLPTLERKIAIITAHCGLSKKEQLDMTYRSHTLLFNEVCGEVEFTTTRPIALFGGNGDKIEHWIYPRKKGKFDGYLTDVDRYTKSMGGDKVMRTSDTQAGDKYIEQFNNFNK